MADRSEQIVEHLFRSEYGKLLAVLTRLFGPSNIQLAEDVVQDTLIAALSHWSTAGIPSNPTGWLVQVAKRKALNELKRNQMIQKHQTSAVLDVSDSMSDVFLENEIEDSQLRMIFACCHHSLDVNSQITLTLKTLCGFGVKEVANALLTTEATVNKRLYRAKEKIRNSSIPFSIPQGVALEQRLEVASLTLYLLFNEGYHSTIGDGAIKKELCLEAVRLTKMLADRFKPNQQLNALLALMCFHIARFDARIDNRGAIVLFEDQDRTVWNSEMIQMGMHYFKRSMQDKHLSPYHVEARIAAEHCLSESFDTTNWQLIYDQYMILQKLKPNPVIQLNLAIILSKTEGIEASLSLLDDLSKTSELKDYHLLPATQGAFHMELHHYQEAIVYFEKVLHQKTSEMERSLIETKVQRCKNRLSQKSKSDGF